MVGCVDFPVEKVVALEGSADTACVTPVAPMSSSSSSDVVPTVVSEVVLPSSPVASEVKVSTPLVNQSPPSQQPSDQLSPTDQPVDTDETPSQPVAETEAQDANLTDKTSLSPPSSDEACQLRLTEAEPSSELQDTTDSSAVAVAVSAESL